MVLLVPLAYPVKTVERPSRIELFFLERVTRSDLLMWAGARVLRTKMVETVLGTPAEDVRAASEDDRRRVEAMLEQILPVGSRARGLLNEGAVARTLRPLPLERMRIPTLIASVVNDGYGTYPGARYTAEHIAGSRFIGYPRGGHMLVGHEAEFDAEVLGFLDALRPAASTEARDRW